MEGSLVLPHNYYDKNTYQNSTDCGSDHVICDVVIKLADLGDDRDFRVPRDIASPRLLQTARMPLWSGGDVSPRWRRPVHREIAARRSSIAHSAL